MLRALSGRRVFKRKCGSRDDPADVCEWKGVTCNADKDIDKFLWINKKGYGTGTLGFEFLPPSIKAVVMYQNALHVTIQLADLPGKMEKVFLTRNNLAGSLDLDRLPTDVRTMNLSGNQFTADPMDGHLYVVGRISTPSWGKPGADRYYGDPPGWHRVSAGAYVIHHCCGIPASVAAMKQKLQTRSARMRAVRAINLIALLLRAGDVHPNPGPSLHVAQFNVLGFSPGKKISLLHKAKMLALDVVLLQELHVTEDEASRLAIPGFHCFAVARDAKGGGVAVLVRDALQCSLSSQSVSEVVEHTTVCAKVRDELSYFISAYFPL
ncbi:hypothetical protein XU18_2818 [Perkinsela sp. CCAP 1560/4]|nr:hypothetical protein XU18_2818 [Perkinsela sp. CCAP 1560/4]|eukprot:KNH06313.1 hypothetical protein XU18_2818 [Perkinsela sp. CCAP 1560/4]